MRIGSWIETTAGETGYIIDYHGSDPVVYFPENDSFRRVAVNNCFEKITNVLGIHGHYQHPKRRKKASEFKMPLSYAVLIGFQPLAAGYYEFKPKLAKRYPWDKGSIWKVTEGSDGHRYLVKEEDTGNKPFGSHQLDNDGTPGESPRSEDGIFDGGPLPGKTYGSQSNPRGRLDKQAGRFTWDEDGFGGVTLFMDDKDIAYFQPGDDAGRFLDEVEAVEKVWEQPGPHGPFNSLDEHLDAVLDQYSVLVD